MKILIVTNVATKGSVGGILSILKEGFKDRGNDVRICYGYYSDHPVDEEYKKICTSMEFKLSAILTRLTGLEGIFNPFSLKRVITEIESYKPDIVQLMNLHAYYINSFKLLDYLKRNELQTVYSMFDAFSFTGKCPFPMDCNKYLTSCSDCNQKKEYPRSAFFDRTSYMFKQKEEAYSNYPKLHFVGGIGIINQAKKSALLHNKSIHLIDEPQDLDNLFFPKDTAQLKEKLGIPQNNKVVIAAAPLESGTNRKQGYLFLDLFHRMENVTGYSFVYIGFNTTKYGNPEKLIKIPYVNSPLEFSRYLSLGDVLFFTSVADTTSCTVIDALACGTPVVGFNIEGMACFNINDKDVMYLAKVGDMDEVESVIRGISRKDDVIINKCRDSVYKTFNKTCIVDKYLNLYKSLLSHDN